MDKAFSDRTFEDEPVRCPDCGWQGTGREAVVVDLYGVAKASEVHCPKCDQTLGQLKKDNDAPGESASDLSFQLG